MEYIENSEEITGYTVKILHKGAFKIRGYTLIIPPAQDDLVAKFWDDALADGRVQRLITAATTPPWLLGLGSWDPECEKHGFRYTICIEETAQTDFSNLETEDHPLFIKEIGESDWMCFMMTHDRFTERFMKDDPYRMMKLLGYKFNAGNLSLGLHFDAYPPGFDPEAHPEMEFWITVKKK